MSDNLWKPDENTSSAISRGNRKIALHWKIKENAGEMSECSFCGKPVWVLIDNSMLTLNGSSHNCVLKKEYDKINQGKINGNHN